MRVKPGPGLVVRDPRTKLLIPAEGVGIAESDLDFVRMLADGDVVAAGDEAAPAEGEDQ